MTNSEILVLVIYIASGLLAGLSMPALAEQPAWPARPIRIVVAYPAGGPTDVIARIVAADISGPLGQQVVVENVSGGAGAIGTRAVAKASFFSAISYISKKPSFWLLAFGASASSMLGRCALLANT